MDDLCSINNCGKINPYHFVSAMASDVITQSSFKGLDRILTLYSHLINCNHCFIGVGLALEEFAVGNDKFPIEKFHKNIGYLENSRHY